MHQQNTYTHNQAPAQTTTALNRPDTSPTNTCNGFYLEVVPQNTEVTTFAHFFFVSKQNHTKTQNPNITKQSD